MAVLDLDQLQRGLGSRQVVGCHGRDRLPSINGEAPGQEGVLPVLRVILVLRRDVGGSDHGPHARQRLGLGGVNGQDFGVGVGAGQPLADQQPRQLDVCGKDRLP